MTPVLMLILILVVYLLGVVVNLSYFKYLNQNREAHDKIMFHSALFVSMSSWITTAIIIIKYYWGKSSLKTKVDDYVKSFEEGK